MFLMVAFPQLVMVPALRWFVNFSYLRLLIFCPLLLKTHWRSMKHMPLRPDAWRYHRGRDGCRIGTGEHPGAHPIPSRRPGRQSFGLAENEEIR